jgi:hypothetical protein
VLITTFFGSAVAIPGPDVGFTTLQGGSEGSNGPVCARPKTDSWPPTGGPPRAPYVEVGSRYKTDETIFLPLSEDGATVSMILVFAACRDLLSPHALMRSGM